MNLQDQDTLVRLVERIEQHESEGTDGWIEQTDDTGNIRVLVGTALELDTDGTRLLVFTVKLAGHWTSAIHYLFERRKSGQGYARAAHYLLSHEAPRTNRRWFCGHAPRSVPHLGVYRGDFGLVGARFRQAEAA